MPYPFLELNRSSSQEHLDKLFGEGLFNVPLIGMETYPEKGNNILRAGTICLFLSPITFTEDLKCKEKSYENSSIKLLRHKIICQKDIPAYTYICLYT